MIAPDSPAPSYIHKQKPNKAVVPLVLPDHSHLPEILEPFVRLALIRHYPHLQSISFVSRYRKNWSVIQKRRTSAAQPAYIPSLDILYLEP